MPVNEPRDPGGCENDWCEKHRAWLRLSYAERLAWLEDAKTFVGRIRRTAEGAEDQGEAVGGRLRDGAVPPPGHVSGGG